MDLHCANCFKTNGIMMILGTSICKECADQAKEEAKKKNETTATIVEKLVKADDIYV